MLNRMEIFYFVAKLNSFSKAALKLGLSKGYVSMQVNALEKELKVKLLNRTTRHLSLTDAGKAFFASCEIIMREKEQAKTALEELQKEPIGMLRISAPNSLCSTFLSVIIPDFLKEYPKVMIDVDGSSIKRDLIKDKFDIVFRITQTPDEQYVAKLISTFQFVTCATPEYFQKHGEPKVPEDLRQHNCLSYSAYPRHNVWHFSKNNKIEEILISGNLAVDNASLIQSALMSGLGIARLPAYFITRELKAGKLKLLFSDYEPTTISIYALYLSSAIALPKVQSFLAYLKQRL